MPPRRRNVRDIELEELRRQVEQLQEQLAQREGRRHNADNHNSENGSSTTDDEDENPFHEESDDHSSHASAPRRRRREFNNFHGAYNVKITIPDFEGRNHPDEFIDWLNTVERVFEYNDVHDQQKVKLVAVKLKKYASLWWEHLKKQRVRDGKTKICTWEKMKKELRRKFYQTIISKMFFSNSIILNKEVCPWKII